MSHSNSSQGSFGRSPRASNSSFGATARKAVPRREEQELPSHWLHRLLEAVSRAEVANVLAARYDQTAALLTPSGDEFHSQALKLYMTRFDFTHDALDVAIRRLLMDIALPRETQQIDRVIEAFAKRYEECEPDLFPSKGELLHEPTYSRHRICFSFLAHDAPYGRLQSKQQEQNDKGRLCPEYEDGWCPLRSLGGKPKASTPLTAGFLRQHYIHTICFHRR